MSNVLINAPKTAKPGEVIELKALIMHPMETGFRAGTNGKIIPRNIIERFVATWNGVEIFNMAFSPAPPWSACCRSPPHVPRRKR